MALGYGELVVDWVEVSGADTYEIRYIIGGFSFSIGSILSSPSGFNSLNITGLVPGTYDIDINATNAYGTSPWSSPALSVVVS
jgi:hypothetical protein